ncbi:MAG: hypothetical protein M3Y27_16840 [Acidobacteriota bacterium]|nr:hypothetical protein [Acidobacteriota bacterium]
MRRTSRQLEPFKAENSDASARFSAPVGISFNAATQYRISIGDPVGHRFCRIKHSVITDLFIPYKHSEDQPHNRSAAFMRLRTDKLMKAKRLPKAQPSTP